MHARTKIRHEMPKRSGLPLFVEGLEALGDTVGRRRDLIGIDGIPLPGEPGSWQTHWIPENQGPAGYWRRRRRFATARCLVGQRFGVEALLETGGFNPVHTIHASRACPAAGPDANSLHIARPATVDIAGSAGL